MTSLLAIIIAQSVWDAGCFENQATWKAEAQGALTMKSRPVSGSQFFEYRVDTDSPRPVSTWCEVTFDWGTKGGNQPGIKSAKLMQDGPTERVVYNRIEQPIVRNRDVTLTVARRAEAGACFIRYMTTNERGPAKDENVIRMDKVWGSWTFTPQGDGGTHVTYVQFSDPGGTIPPFLAHGAQKDAARDSVAMVKQLVEK